MSDILRTILLGVIQGLTEFLPVSSSGHIEIFKFLFGEDAVGKESLMLTVVLHFATALSTIVVFREFIWDLIKSLFRKGGKYSRKFVMNIFISMIPAVLVGLILEDFINGLFTSNILLVSLMLIITGVLLLIADNAKRTNKQVDALQAFIIGIAQAIAILPGISRSGATISTSVLLGIDREAAARFSFLMVIPLIIGKVVKDLLDNSYNMVTVSGMELIAGFIAAFITGIVACNWMLKIVKRSKLKYFSIYCFIIASIGLIYHYY